MHGLDDGIRSLRCPSCGGSIALTEGQLTCSACGEVIPVVDGIPRFPVESGMIRDRFDRLSPIYESPAWFPIGYRFVGGPFVPADDRRVVADLLDQGEPVASDGAGGDLLDVACGTGRFTRYIPDRFRFVWGIDLSDGMLRRARRYAGGRGVENVAFARMDATDLYFADGWFDAVSCCWAIHLVPDPTVALREIHRVLKPGGRFAGTTVVDEYVLALPGARSLMRGTFDARVFDENEFRCLLREAGFTAGRFERRGAVLFFGARSAADGDG